MLGRHTALPRIEAAHAPPAALTWLPCSKRYTSTYLVSDVLACIPLNCIMTACDNSLNYYNSGDLLK